MLRARLAAELKRLISVITADGRDLVVTLKTRPGTEPVQIPLKWSDDPARYEVGTLPFWPSLRVPGLRPGQATEEALGEAFYGDKGAMAKLRGGQRIEPSSDAIMAGIREAFPRKQP